MARLDYRYGQCQWVDVHPGDMLPVGNYQYIVVTEDMINPGEILKFSDYWISNVTILNSGDFE